MRFSGFSELLGHWAAATPDAPALRFERGGAVETLTYAQLARQVEEHAARWRGRRTDRACGFLFGEENARLIPAFLGAVAAGVPAVMLDDGTPPELLRLQLAAADVSALEGPEDLCAELGALPERPSAAPAHGVLFFTSGTSERSKAVVLTEQSLCASAYNGGALLPLAPDDTLLCLLPLAHVFGFVCGLLWGLSCGACVALGRGARHYVDDCAFFRPTAVSVVPLLLGFLLKGNLLNEELRLILVGAGDCPSSLLAAAKARGIRVSFGYGLTETSSGVALSLGDDPYAMTVCPDDCVTLAADGEILLSAPTCMMQGYYRQPTATAAALADGVLHTGDLGRLDEAGLLHITGRKKDVLVLPDGTKLFLPEAEAQLAALLGAGDYALALSNGRVVLAVHGDARTDEALRAAIEPYQSARPRGQQVSAIIRTDAPLPRTATGKIKRWELQGRIDQ